MLMIGGYKFTVITLNSAEFVNGEIERLGKRNCSKTCHSMQKMNKLRAGVSSMAILLRPGIVICL